MGQVDGKVAIVTGGASVIGAACAATLAREGAKIVITDLDDAAGQAGSAGRNVPLDPNEIAQAGVPFGKAGTPQDIATAWSFSPRTPPNT
jgi:glycine/D-amino acid oxidase-like deaminating enzyme